MTRARLAARARGLTTISTSLPSNIEESDEPTQRKSGKPPACERGDLQLVDLGHIGSLRQATAFADGTDLSRQFSLGQCFHGPPVAEICEQMD